MLSFDHIRLSNQSLHCHILDKQIAQSKILQKSVREMMQAVASVFVKPLYRVLSVIATNLTVTTFWILSESGSEIRPILPSNQDQLSRYRIMPQITIITLMRQYHFPTLAPIL